MTSEFFPEVNNLQDCINEAKKGLLFGSDYQELNLAAYNGESIPDQYKIFIPDNYYKEGFTHFSENMFPCSSTGKIPGWWAHREGNYIICAGPPALTPRNPEIAPGFLKLLSDTKPTYIIALGSMLRDFADYSKETNIKIINIVVRDNCPINLTLQQIQELLAIKNTSILIHCTSGVGRTGQMRLILGALDLINTDQEFAKAFECFASNKPVSADKINYVANKMRDLLCALRKVRYAVQTEEQFTSTFQQLVFIRKVQLGFLMSPQTPQNK